MLIDLTEHDPEMKSRSHGKTIRPGIMWILVHLASILLLAVVCCRTPRADEYSYTPPDVIESRASATVEDQTTERTSETGHKSRVLSRLTPSQKEVKA
jgi:hypothetical protein